MFINGFTAPKRLQTNVFGYKVNGESLVNVWTYLTHKTVRHYSDCHLLLPYADGIFPASLKCPVSTLHLQVFDKYYWKRFKPPDCIIYDLFHGAKLLPKILWNTIATSLQKPSTAYEYCFLSWIEIIKTFFMVDHFQHSHNVKSDMHQICTQSEQIQNAANTSFSMMNLNSFSVEITKAERLNKMFLECIVRNKYLIRNEQYYKICSQEDNKNNIGCLLKRDILNLNLLHMLSLVPGMRLFMDNCAFSTHHGQYHEGGSWATSVSSAPVIHVLRNKMELNHYLLHTMFEFKPASKLNNFLISKTGVNKSYYSLIDILLILRDVIKRESLFDPGNVSVIFCSGELEDTLNVRAFHLSQLRALILAHVTKLQSVTLDDDPTPTRIIRHASLSMCSRTNKDARFTLKPAFLKVIQSVQGTNLGKTVFTYSEIRTLLSMYIVSRKDQLFDQRNIELALVDKDLLGEAFKLAGFHKSQLPKLIQGQLIPVDSDSHRDVTVVTRSCSPGLNVRVIFLDKQ